VADNITWAEGVIVRKSGLHVLVNCFVQLV
jgi:hypothetical protein